MRYRNTKKAATLNATALFYVVPLGRKKSNSMQALIY